MKTEPQYEAKAKEYDPRAIHLKRFRKKNLSLKDKESKAQQLLRRQQPALHWHMVLCFTPLEGPPCQHVQLERLACPDPTRIFVNLSTFHNAAAILSQ